MLTVKDMALLEEKFVTRVEFHKSIDDLIVLMKDMNEAIIQRMDQRFDKMDERFEKMDQRFDRMDRKLEAMDVRLTRVESKMNVLGSHEYRIEKLEDHTFSVKV